VSPVRYELRFYFPQDGILHSQRREIIKSYISILKFTLAAFLFPVSICSCARVTFQLTSALTSSTTSYIIIEPKCLFFVVSRIFFNSFERTPSPKSVCRSRACVGFKNNKNNSMALARKRIKPTELPPPVGGVRATFCW
jgi:hypothetical protein